MTPTQSNDSQIAADRAYQLRLQAYANHIPGRQHDVAGAHYDVTDSGAWKRTTVRKSSKALHRMEVEALHRMEAAKLAARKAAQPKGQKLAADLELKRAKKARKALRAQAAEQKRQDQLAHPDPTRWMHATARAIQRSLKV